MLLDHAVTNELITLDRDRHHAGDTFNTTSGLKIGNAERYATLAAQLDE
jgi:hypothetical protein